MPKSFHSERYKALCRLLIARRRAGKLTQVEVARRLTKPQSYVAKYEAGERRIDVIEYLEIAAAIGFDPAELLTHLATRKRRPQPSRT